MPRFPLSTLTNDSILFGPRGAEACESNNCVWRGLASRTLGLCGNALDFGTPLEYFRHKNSCDRQLSMWLPNRLPRNWTDVDIVLSCGVSFPTHPTSPQMSGTKAPVVRLDGKDCVADGVRSRMLQALRARNSPTRLQFADCWRHGPWSHFGCMFTFVTLTQLLEMTFLTCQFGVWWVRIRCDDVAPHWLGYSSKSDSNQIGFFHHRWTIHQRLSLKPACGGSQDDVGGN